MNNVIENDDGVGFIPDTEQSKDDDGVGFIPDEKQDVPRGTSVEPSALEQAKPVAKDYIAQRKKDMLTAIGQNPMVLLAAPAMAPYYKSIGTGVGEAAQNIANFAIKNMRNDPMSKAGMGASQNINKPSGQPISIFDSTKAYDPEVAALSRELAPMAIPLYGQEALAAKAASLVPYAASTGFKGAMAGLAKGTARQVAKAVPRSLYGGAFGAAAEMAEDKEATPESVAHAGKVGGEINAVFGGVLDIVPGVYKGIANHYRNVADEAAKQGGGVLTPTQSLTLHKGLKDDILSFPDLVKAPKLQSFFHGFLRYIPGTGIAKDEAGAVGRLENDAKTVSQLENDSGKVYTETLGDINEADPVKARESIANDIISDVNQRFPLKVIEKEIPEQAIAEKTIPEFAEIKGLEEVDPLASRENIVKDINKHVKSQEEYFAPKFQEMDKTPIEFVSSFTKDEATNLLKEAENARKKGLGDILPSGLAIKLKNLAKGGAREKTELEEMLPEKYQKQIDAMFPQKEEETSLGAFRKAIAKHRMKANELESSGRLSEANIYRGLAKAMDKDLEASVADSAPNIYDKFKALNTEYKDAVIPFKHPKVSGLNKITDETINYSSEGELENILSNTNNRKAILQLPQETKNKIALRLINHNINPKTTNQTQRFFDAYSKLNSYERRLLDNSSKNALDKFHSDFITAKKTIDVHNENIIIKNKEIAKKREELEKQNEKLYTKGIKRLIEGDVNFNSEQLEDILRDMTNKKFINGLPQETKKKIFSRILNSNIGKKEEALKTRSERIATAYGKMSSYERELLDEATRAPIENIVSRVKQLEPVLKRTTNSVWRAFYHGRHVAYGIGVGALGLANPYMMAAGVPLIAAGRILKSPKLMETYKTGKYPETSKVKKEISSLLSKAAITQSGGK